MIYIILQDECVFNMVIFADGIYIEGHASTAIQWGQGSHRPGKVLEFDLGH